VVKAESTAAPAAVVLERDSTGEADAERIADLVQSPQAAPNPTLYFSSGRSVTVTDGAPEQLTVRSPEGAVELAVRFTPEGPVLSFSAAALDLRSSGTMRLACGKLEVDAREGIALTTGGDVRAEADAVAIRARLGDVAIEANDDVRVDGERIRLND
jgi:hypothetical protein